MYILSQSRAHYSVGENSIGSNIRTPE